MLKFAPLALLVVASPAMADCAVHGPGVMYLGSNSNYDWTIEMVRDNGCTISLSSTNPAIVFTSANVVTRPRGAVIQNGATNFYYTAAEKGGADLFRVKICGTDVKGTGCNVHTYHVTIHDVPK